MIRETSFFDGIKKIEVKRKYVYISWSYGKTLRYLKTNTDIDFSMTVHHNRPFPYLTGRM